MNHWSRLLVSSTMVAVLLALVFLGRASAQTITPHAAPFAQAQSMVASRNVSLSTPSPFAPNVITYFRYRNDASNLCIGIQPGQPISYAGDWGCNFNNDQLWTDVNCDHYAHYYCQLQNRNGQCLGVYGGSTSAGARIVGWGCNWNKDQWWAGVKCGNDFALQDLQSGLVIDLKNGSTSNGAELVQEPFTGTLEQCWRNG